MPTHRHVWGEMAEGMLWVWHQPFILTMTLLMGAGAFVFSGNTLIIIILAQQHHASAVVIGLIFAVGGVGSILGSLLAPRLEHRLTVGQSILLTRWYFVLSWPLYALVPFPLVLGAIEFGTGFAAAKMFGSQHNDALEDKTGRTFTNHAGGIVGGITNGNDIVFRIVVKPTSSTPKEQQTLNVETGNIEPFSVKGRHDLCIALRVPVILEAVTAMVLADLLLINNSKIITD